MNLTYIYRSILCWLDRGKHQRDWQNDNDIAEMQRLLYGKMLIPDSYEDKMFWIKLEDDLGIEDRTQLRHAVAELHRKSLKDWKEQKPIKKESD